jgi:hypothetical protein
MGFKIDLLDRPLATDSESRPHLHGADFYFKKKRKSI